jgi:WD40 repeat protein
MQAAKKIESLCISRQENMVFTGNLIGQISVLDMNTFAVRNEIFAHSGTINAMASHPTLDYIATLGADLSLALWRYNNEGDLFQLCHISLRGFSPDEEGSSFFDVYSQSQPIAFHQEELKLLTRTGNAGLIELIFTSEGEYEVSYCARIHREFDLITVAYVGNTNLVLTGSGDGEVCLSDRGVIQHRWQINDTSIHWFEPMNESEYLVACDSRVIARIDVKNFDNFVIGEPFSRDDLEHVCYDKKNNFAYTCGFDWNICKIDVQTCNATEVIYHAPFKCRWMFYTEQHQALIIQCRNGSAIKFNLNTLQVDAVRKETPDALWTSVINRNKEIFIGGEGNFWRKYTETGFCPFSLKATYHIETRPLPFKTTTYTKRIDYRGSDDCYLLGQASGELALIREDQFTVLHTFSFPIRDVALDADDDCCYVATEDCCITKINFNGTIEAQFCTDTQIPIWSLAYHPELQLVVAFERYGNISVLDTEDLSVVKICEGKSGRAKRAKWLDQDHIVFSYGSELHLYTLSSNSTELLLDFVGNTIEDFTWDEGQNYFITICYTKMVTLYDFESLQRLDQIADQMDYSKGISMLPRTNEKIYPLDFITYGRGGVANHYRIHNEHLLSLGPIVSTP